MAAPTPPKVLCSPFVGRTIKGWVVKVRICFSLTPAAASSATLAADSAGVFDEMAILINALSDATFQPLNSNNYITENGYGGSGSVDNAEDVATFTFATALGAVGKVSIPAPKSSIFLTDEQTVDPANTDVAAFVTAMIGGAPDAVSGWYGATKSGASYAVFLGGLRIRRKTRRRMNIWVRDPNLSIPAI